MEDKLWASLSRCYNQLTSDALSNNSGTSGWRKSVTAGTLAQGNIALPKWFWDFNGMKRRMLLGRSKRADSLWVVEGSSINFVAFWVNSIKSWSTCIYWLNFFSITAIGLFTPIHIYMVLRRKTRKRSILDPYHVFCVGGIQWRVGGFAFLAFQGLESDPQHRGDLQVERCWFRCRLKVECLNKTCTICKICFNDLECCWLVFCQLHSMFRVFWNAATDKCSCCNTVPHYFTSSKVPWWPSDFLLTWLIGFRFGLHTLDPLLRTAAISRAKQPPTFSLDATRHRQGP